MKIPIFALLTLAVFTYYTISFSYSQNSVALGNNSLLSAMDPNSRNNITSAKSDNKNEIIIPNIITAVAAVTAGILGAYFAGWYNRKLEEDKRKAEEKKFVKR